MNLGLQDFEFKRVLGVGAFGAVWLIAHNRWIGIKKRIQKLKVMFSKFQQVIMLSKLYIHFNLITIYFLFQIIQMEVILGNYQIENVDQTKKQVNFILQKLFWQSNIYIHKILFTEIQSLKMYFWIKIGTSNQQILVYLKLDQLINYVQTVMIIKNKIVIYQIKKILRKNIELQELQIIFLLKLQMDYQPITLLLIGGVQALCYMNLLLGVDHLADLVQKNYFKILKKVKSNGLKQDIQMMIYLQKFKIQQFNYQILIIKKDQELKMLMILKIINFLKVQINEYIKQQQRKKNRN
ncbi:hypothetical protein IMG5_203360 [Ichthyophthirius multifiliis]|uniref:Protein kinase domain-containing protein n=1 Tax=Ichthyophthirius multifiliis TaxID=5932 RepID=G0R6B2_ICHMU|nr:hypothetical protein IMG5_203360 [Ichthyophthirius multifiliis]EGR26996.1 hypothetical protein IMG5_203360 [Ichthyophthirius multifiliis]|eukprot:XP_004023880.1 hypothetical protein IMG5_203360 [Ichthyophthirius multifiliis]